MSESINGFAVIELDYSNYEFHMDKTRIWAFHSDIEAHDFHKQMTSKRNLEKVYLIRRLNVIEIN